ncbi:hypothetical protein [Capillimicrobium parvum]|uniref:Uncharacterized protein n=1 Tax=Capillimicrobium parvum TaxID=2884022 RepID=A0A9E7C241_9ACTN|nr:hypothetical protein [Capillimicrobium parvum]UGS37334.1 hypothetical protein DSM104329_03749 [Capillimicrobium parvum]
MERPSTQYDQTLASLAGELPGPFAFDDLVRRTEGIDVPPGAAWDWWRRAQDSGALVFAGVRPHSELDFVGPRLYVLAD